MNAVTHPEAQALHAIIPAQPAQNMLLVPLSQLRPSRRNVRKSAGQSIDPLASSIERVGSAAKPDCDSCQRWRALRSGRRWP